MINTSVVVGRLAQDPDIKFFPSGKVKTTFRLAVSRNYKNNENKYETDYISCVIWGKPAEVIANNASKGNLIGVVGRIETRHYENTNNQKVYVTEVICNSFQFLENKEQTQNRKQQQANDQSSEIQEPINHPPVSDWL